MHAVVRTYSSAGAKKLFDVLEERKKDVEDLIRPIKGFVSYCLIRTADGGVSVTVRTRPVRKRACGLQRIGSGRMRPAPALARPRSRKVRSSCN